MGLQDYFNWRSQTQSPASTDIVGDDEPTAEVDEPPDCRHVDQKLQNQPGFQKSIVRSKVERNESLLTRALLKSPEVEPERPDASVNTTVDLCRRRSMVSNASMASTAELTSDGGLTSPARTNTPSPPPPGALYASFAPYQLINKAILPQTSAPPLHLTDVASHPDIVSVSPKAPTPPVAPKRRCITFACRGDSKPATAAVQAPAPAPAPTAASEQPKQRKISFFCDGKASEKAKKAKAEAEAITVGESSRAPKKVTSRSPSIPRKSPRASASPRPHKNSLASRRGSHSPVAVRVKPKYIIADEKTLQSSEATRFHEFASEEPQEDDWIRNEVDITKKMTVNDTLKMENAFRQLGNEAEEEALEEDEDDEVDDDEDEDDEDEFDEGDEDEEDDDDASDGNETDNEAGFAESDDSDAEGEFAFWTPGRNIPRPSVGDASTYRPSAHRAASMSSIDSASNAEFALGPKSKKSQRRAIKIRPGTPELPDSTDFVCGTLDEDRPMENAYISCMAARKNAKHKRTPQDIDPSFPTSDPENEDEDEDSADRGDDSEDQIWLHGKFEDSEDEGKGRRRSMTKAKKSPALSPRRHHSPPPVRRIHSPPPPPRRHHSPPPPKQRHRSPPPRKLFGQSPRRMRSPPPARAIHSPAASPTHATSGAIAFIPLASRPGLTHTKSLPRAPNAFGRQYKASRIEAAAGTAYNDSDGPDGHVRGAIDIVKGLEQKRQRRKEKFLQKHCNRKQKSHGERKPQPGKGAERMRELGLLMAGKNTNATDPYMMSA